MKRGIYDCEGHGHFVTFSCYKRQSVLSHDRAKAIVVSHLSVQLKRMGGMCLGYVVMPDHVHAAVRFNEPDRISLFMQQWKRLSSKSLKAFLRKDCPAYASGLDLSKPIWTPKYYGFNLYSEAKLSEKLVYMHNNPVKAGLVKEPCDWKFSSARWYEKGISTGVAIG